MRACRHDDRVGGFLIHGVGADSDAVARLRASGAALTWCPSSNHFLFGRTAPFDAAALTALYPGGRDDYVAQVRASLSEAVAAGFLLADDSAEIEALLAAGYPGR